MKRVAIGLLFCLISSVSWAQKTVTVIGPVTPGDCVAFNSTTVIKDAGITCGGGGGGTPGGSNGQVQFNNGGAFGGLTTAQLTALINPFTSLLSGVVPASGGDITTFLRADATFAVPPTFSSVAPGYVPASGGGTTNFLRADGTFAAPTVGSILSSNNTFSGDNFFGSGRPWCDVRAKGAVGNGSTDDTAAFTTCVTTLNALGGGALYVPPGTYCLKTGPVNIASNAIRVVGASALSSSLSACGVDVTLITLNSRRSSLEHLSLTGKGAIADTFSATQVNVNVGSACVECTLLDLFSNYGAGSFSIATSDAVINNVFASLSYGPSIISDSGGGNWYIRDKIDQSWPTGTVPTLGGSTVPAWSAGAAVVLNQIVQTAGFVIQCTQAGTTGGSPPTLLNYGAAINDNTAKWGLAGAVTYSGIIISGANSEHSMTMMDFSGSYSNGLTVSGAILKLSIDHSTFGQQLSSAINLTGAGKNIVIANNEMASGRFSAVGNGVSIGTGWAGQVIITGNLIIGPGEWGVVLQGGLNTIISDNQIFGMTAQAVFVSAGVTSFHITGNMLGSSASFTPTNGAAVIVSAGSSDFYNITNNTTNGLAVTDSGSGTHKTISGNN